MLSYSVIIWSMVASKIEVLRLLMRNSSGIKISEFNTFALECDSCHNVNEELHAQIMRPKYSSSESFCRF